MRSIAFLLVILFSIEWAGAQDNDPVLMTIGDSKVLKSEFERIYRKNNPRGGDNETSVDEYLGLFVNFKLKVKDAMESGLDTAAAFVKELKGYREQLAKPYLTDNEVTGQLVREAYERAKTDITASHILVQMDRYPSPEDTLKAYKKAWDIYNRIVKGKEAFDKVATQVTANPADKIVREDINFSVLMLVYNFENAAYGAKVGELTKPVRTRFGYHVIMVTDRRPALGQVKTAHILVSLPKSATPEQEARAKAEADDIYRKLKEEGGDFEQMAKTYSADKNSSEKGGALPWFGTGRMVPEFENAVASIQEEGGISQPVRTSYGWHIIKLLEKKAIPEFEKLQAELRERIARDERSKISTQSRIAKIKEEYAFREMPENLTPMRKMVDESLFEKKWSKVKTRGMDKTLFTLGDSTYTQSDFADYMEINQRRGPKNMSPQDFVGILYNEFVDASCLAYEDVRLEKKYAPFRDLVAEYHDGILLFEMMDKKVWSRAVKDSAGLEAFYAKNKEKWMWGERAAMVVYECKDADTASRLRKTLLKKGNGSLPEGEILSKVNAKDENAVAVKEKGKVQQGENDWMEKAGWKAGVSEDIPQGEKILVVHVREIIAPQPKTLKEAKGLVTAAYQEELEKEWIAELKAKHTVNINRDVLKSIQ